VVSLSAYTATGVLFGVVFSFTVAAGSAASFYNYTGPTSDLSSTDFLLGVSIQNTATAASAVVGAVGLIYES
jgi:hypothetical protein